jgi:hypothetical protein
MIMGLIFHLSIDPGHFNQKTDEQGCADENDKACRKKGHDKTERIIQGVGSRQEFTSKYEEKNRDQGQDDLDKPPLVFLKSVLHKLKNSLSNDLIN